VQTHVAHEALDGAPGHVTGPVALGDLGAVEHDVHLAGPEHRVVAPVDATDLASQGVIARTPGTGRPAAAGVVGARGDLDAGAGQRLADRLDPEVRPVVIDERVDDL
jgi:hypothetical protein